MACSKSSKKMKDFFENAPDLVIGKILENLPIRMAAQASVLSKKWRHAWLSLENLIFDSDFQKQQENEDGSCNWRKSSRIISRILLHHNGPIHSFDLYVPEDADEDHMNLSQWISFLSKNGVQMITITHWDSKMYIPSNIFRCSELVYLELANCTLNPPPTCFHGFPKLKYLELVNVEFTNQNIFCSLIENCRMLVTLILVDWVGIDHFVIDAPSLQTLIIIGDFESLAFRNVSSLESISMGLRKMPEILVTVEIADAINLLASSCQLQCISFDDHLCKIFAAGGLIRSSSVTFNQLQELRLINISLGKFRVLRDVLSMIESCPYIKKLIILVTSGKNVGQHMVDFNYNYKLDHLQEVYIEGITGSSAELKLVEYLLAISPVLENMFFYSGKLGIESEPKMLRALMGFPRASPKARLLFLENRTSDSGV
ncbi:F-box/FBD/LRR-repeat protein At1g13570-like isoform X2 [Silene latifolia]|uniref:F-box/FBD/LRR-repeat protein At1g13570-like isoform X2 n=1 Tax=Silene latifolia TaxID=37657 RepID=UPI003D777986